MKKEPAFFIDLNQKFEHLRHAPIIEAVVDIRTRNSEEWAEKNAKEQLKTVLPEYPVTLSVAEFRHEFSFGPVETTPAPKKSQSWNGLRVETSDHLQIAQFNRNGFVFSRLAPYEDWERFTGEGLRLWRLYMGLVKPQKIERLGVRFINRIDVDPKGFKASDHLRDIPGAFIGSDIPLSGFLYNDLFKIPGYPYIVKIVRTIQTPQQLSGNKIGIIIDIDVFTDQDYSAVPTDPLEKQLIEMRWLKNKIFFQSITSEAKELLK